MTTGSGHDQPREGASSLGASSPGAGDQSVAVVSDRDMDAAGRRSTARSSLRGRPALYTDYARDQAIWNTNAKRVWTLVLVVVALLVPFQIMPVIGASLGTPNMVNLLTTVAIFAIGGIGLNLVTGYAGQVSLGHAFFLAIGAYTAAILGGSPDRGLVGYELDVWIWLPLAGLVPMVIGLIVAPLAARVRGLYLAILTLGLVMVGEHVFKEARPLTGGAGVGRAAARPRIGEWDLFSRQTLFGFEFRRGDLFYLLCVVLLIVLGILARNLARSRQGRAFAAVRDRDIAAEVMGVPLLRTKVVAFGVSSFYAGIAGALLATSIGHVTAERWNLFLSIDFLAVILIGGVATISGSIMGAAFVVLLPRGVELFAPHMPFVGGVGSGAFMTTFQLQRILFGLLIVGFLVLEPRGLFGLWLRVRNYFKAWPFSY
ncbi:MAG: branched-chain amino acid ABC transporter permease [Nitriliruptoraceae bacterium]